MAAHVDLIYCADGNARFAEIAIKAGFLYGAQLPPRGLPYPPYFADQNWKTPDRERYMAELEKHKPYMATVLDWERWDQLPEVLGWAEDAALYVEEVIIIPKVIGGVSSIPRVIGNKPIRLGYSVPTKFGGTLVHPVEFLGWPVHLLGGSPLVQARLGGLFSLNKPRLFSDAEQLNVVSADGNYHHKMATRYNQYFVADGSARYARNPYWPTLREANGGQNWGDGRAKADAPYEAFRRSCEAIMKVWKGES